MTRPKATAKPGYVTLQDAADRAGVSRSAAYRQLRRHNIAYIIEDDAIQIAEEHVDLIEPRIVKHADGRVAVMVRVPIEVHEAFERAAGDQPVSSWLIELGKRASEWPAAVGKTSAENAAAFDAMYQGKRRRTTETKALHVWQRWRRGQRKARAGSAPKGDK